jgi:hypothetical protein
VDTVPLLTIAALGMLLGWAVGGDMRHIASSSLRALMWVASAALAAYLGYSLAGSLAGEPYRLTGALIGLGSALAGIAASYSRRKKN